MYYIAKKSLNIYTDLQVQYSYFFTVSELNFESNDRRKKTYLIDT